MVVNQKQKHKLKRFVRQLDSVRGRHTELVSVYIPAGYDIIKIIGHLQQEQGTAANIKDKTTQQHVIDSLERMIRQLRLYKRTPENGLAIFSGNVSEREGKVDIQVFWIEPPEPLNMRIYRCDQRFKTDLLKEMMEYKEEYGLIVIDRREANIGILKGTSIVQSAEMHSRVPGKTRAGGQCLADSTLVQMSNGDIVHIKNIHTNVKCVNLKNFQITDTKTVAKWNTKKKLAYLITTKCPRAEILCSADHLFFTRSKDGILQKPASELGPNDFLLMPEKIEVKGRPQPIKILDLYEYYLTESGRKLLKQNRKEKKLLQKDIAKKICATQTAISKLEIGKINFRLEKLKNLCKVLGIEPEWFIKNNTNPYSATKIPHHLNGNLAQIGGYYLGDGSLDDSRVSFAEQRKEVAEYYLKKFADFFNAKSSIRFRKKKNYYELRLSGRPIEKLFRQEFPKGMGVPPKVLKSPNKVVAAFLRGFFDAEGYVSSRVGIGIHNKLFAKQLQLMLLRFGILSSFSTHNNRKNPYSKNPRYNIEVCDKTSHTLFKEQIGFSSKEKQIKLCSLIRHKKDKDSTRQILPKGSEIRKIIESHGYSIHQKFKQIAPSGFFLDKREMSKTIFRKRIVEKAKFDNKLYSNLKKVLMYNLIPVKINKVNCIKADFNMTDISTKSENFIAEGLVVHNSALRFARLREIAAHEFFCKAAEAVQKEFLDKVSRGVMKGVIVGGPGPTKEEFVSKGYINRQIADKIIAIKDISYTGEFGLKELVDKSQDVLAQEVIANEKKIMEKFFELLAKQPNKVTYGLEQVKKALEMGAVETLLISEELDDDIAESLEETAEKFGTDVQFISLDTGEGAQLKNLGKIAAILRFELY